MAKKIPFLDLLSQNEPIRQELLDAVRETIDASDFVLGPRVDSFERAFADYCECRYAVGVNSGTDALFLILRALGVGPGDEVITVPNVFIAAVEAICHVGATPVFADVSEDTFCLDPVAAEKAVTRKTKAIIPIHLFGQCCDMDAILDVASACGARVIEDACQAHGATYKGRKVGSLGAAAAFSFYPTKNLSAFGDGGAVTTNDPELAERIRRLRHHAQKEKSVHDELGFNSRLDSLQAAVLRVKLRRLDAWNTARRELADRVRDRVAAGEYAFQRVLADSVPVYHILAVRHPRRQRVHEELDRAGIGWGGHITMPIHFQEGYRFLGYGKGSFPVAERLCEELVSLPIYPTLRVEDADDIARALSRVAISV
jgi:dTDP-4-amino-4,6-dideoxygalactose transaminase